MQELVFVGLVAVLFLAYAFGRIGAGPRGTRRTTTQKAASPPQQSAGAPATPASATPLPTLPRLPRFKPTYLWLVLAGGIMIGVIAGVVLLGKLPGSGSIMPGPPAAGYPELPTTPGEMWWLLIAVPALAATTLLLRTKGTQPHLIAAAILGIFAIVVFGLWIIQSSSASKKTPKPPQSTRAPAPQQSLYLYPGQVWSWRGEERAGERLVKAYRNQPLERQALIKFSSVSPGQKPFQLSWKRVGERCAIEQLVERKGGPFGLEITTEIIQIGPYEWEDERDHPELKGVSAMQFRPVGCEEVTIAIQIRRPQS